MDKAIETWNLPQGAKVKADITLDGEERNMRKILNKHLKSELDEKEIK